ncbi:MAG: tetratricopeptide repeat protein [Spirochaetia bacterium]
MNYTELFEEALRAGRNHDYARSVEILLRIVGSTDKFPQALLYLGRSYHALGEHAKAAQALNFFVQQKPGSAAGHFFLGRAYLALEAYPPAVRHLRRATEVNPKFAAAFGLLGFAWLKSRRSEKAIWCFAKALELDPNNARLQVGYLNTALVLAIRLFHRGQLVDSARLFTEVLEQRQTSILPHLYLASIYKELGKDNASLFHIDAASQMSPQDPFLHLQKALVLLSQEQKKEAAEELRIGTQLLKSAVSPEGTTKDVLRFLTVNLFREGRYRETILHGTRLLKDDYSDPYLHMLVGESYRNLGELGKAKNHFRRALEKDKSSLEIRYGLLGVLWDRGEFEELLTEAGHLLQRDPADETALYFRSLALARTDASLEEVLGELQRQVKARGPDLALMAELAAAYARAGLPELAEGWYKRVLRVSADDLDTLEALADIYETLDKPELRRDVLRRYLSLDPDDKEARRQLVRLLLRLQSFADAAEQIGKLLPLEPRNSKLKSALALCYRRTGKYAEALVILRDLLSTDNGSEELIKAAVYCLDKIGARKVGIKVMEGFMKQNGESLSLLLMLGVLHYQESTLEKSAELFRRAVSLSPKDWRANRNLGMVYRRMGNGEYADKFLAKAKSLRKTEAGAT